MLRFEGAFLVVNRFRRVEVQVFEYKVAMFKSKNSKNSTTTPDKVKTLKIV